MVLDKSPVNDVASDEDKLLYLINSNSTDGILYGRKKLTKLGFFAEHWLPEEDLLTSRQKLGNFNFTIYKYGPFSKQLFRTFDRLKDDSLIIERRQPRGNSQIEVTEKGRDYLQYIDEFLTHDEKEQIRRVGERLSDKPGYELEKMSLEYLGIKESEKQNYMGTSVDTLISEAS